MVRLFCFIVAAFVLALLPSCGTTSQQPDDPNKVSNIPWNRPEKWEGQGPLGGMMGSQ